MYIIEIMYCAISAVEEALCLEQMHLFKCGRLVGNRIYNAVFWIGLTFDA